VGVADTRIAARHGVVADGFVRLPSVCVQNFADCAAVYGAIGGVIVLMPWFYLSGFALLVGAELNAEIEKVAALSHG
jgi:uncharacterized BrkB/YihY/UPF0761 family membrane protein